MNLPTQVTLLRIALIPVFVILYYVPWFWAHVLAVVIYTIAALTDLLDGYLARKLGQSSQFGAFLDPVADKLIVVVALVLLVANKNLPYLALPSVVIIGREIIISGLREWMAQLGKRTHVAVTVLAKYKTVMQMIAIGFLLACHPGVPVIGYIVGYIGLYAAAVITLWTMMVYLKAAWPDLTSGMN